MSDTTVNDQSCELALGAEIHDTHRFSRQILVHRTDFLYATFSFTISHLISEIAICIFSSLTHQKYVNGILTITAKAIFPLSSTAEPS